VAHTRGVITNNLNELNSVEDVCKELAALRSLNAIFGILNILLFASLLQHIHPNASRHVLASRVLAISLFPVLFFFNFVYYTDAGKLIKFRNDFY
jgi:alpha-1,2-glucosyltransferase